MRLLQQSNSGLSSSRYTRLMLLALAEMIIDTSVNIWILTFNISANGLEPFTSWAAVHYNFSRIQSYPQFIVPPKYWDNIVEVWYIIPIATVSFWSFFAFGQESMAEYRAWYAWFRRVILRKSPPSTGDSLPSYSSDPTTQSSGTKKGGFRFKLSIPMFRSSGGSSSDSPSSPTTPATVRGKKFDVILKGKPSKGFSIGDSESFTSADEKSAPLSPISPMTPVNNRMPASYLEADLDTSVFDTISHVTVPSTRAGVPIISEPSARSESPEIQEIDRRPLEGSATSMPYGTTLQDSSPAHVTFGDTAVPRSESPINSISGGIKVEVDVNVV
jgi:hypothetical protein